jgi:hypothetical protein
MVRNDQARCLTTVNQRPAQQASLPARATTVPQGLTKKQWNTTDSEVGESVTPVTRSTAQARRASVTQLSGGSSAQVHMISLHAIRVLEEFSAGVCPTR